MASLVLLTIWLLGAWLRIYRQARFYQIEEYMSRRYLRWLFADRRRALPVRPTTAWLLGSALSVLLGEAPGSPLPAAVGAIAAVIAVFPPAEREVKKSLVLTMRVKRLLFSAGFVSLTVMIAGHFAIASLAAASRMTVAVSASLGFIVFLLAPIWLVAGNALAQPVEGVLRRRYLRQAQATLQQINPKVIGITGSYGKTTTKHFLSEIMSLRFHTYATPKSYNTLMGICLAINRDLADDYRAEYFISEMGAYVEGEIERICQLTPPDIAIITEVGPQHLERFGSLDNVRRAKYELVKNLPPDGVAVFNWDNAYIRDMVELGYPATRLTVSRELTLEQAEAQGVTWLASEIEEDLSGLSFRLTRVASGESMLVSTALVGLHNVTNLLLCIAVAFHEGIPLRDIALRIRGLRPAESRLVAETSAAGITIINDAYSANPVGVISALRVLGMHKSGKRLLITPGMIELGDLHDAENRKLGLLAAEHATDIILIGRAQTVPIADAVRSTAFDPERLHIADSLQDAVAWYREHLEAGDTVLFLNDLPDTY